MHKEMLQQLRDADDATLTATELLDVLQYLRAAEACTCVMHE